MLAKMLVLLALAPVLVQGGAFLRNQRHKADARRFRQDVENALHEVQGCGGLVQLENLADLERRLLPVWRSLPKDGDDRVERTLLRHLVHRYFRQRYSFIIRGFEESRPANDSAWAVEQTLSERLPGHIEAALGTTGKGFALPDAVRIVAMLEELILDQEVSLLDEAYSLSLFPKGATVDENQLMKIMEIYLDLWLQHERLPHWRAVLDFVRGEARALAFRRRSAKRGGGLALSGQYTFDDAREVVKSITTSIGSFFEPVCRAVLQDPLERMDPRGTGRVPLAKFYEASKSFSESLEHLRAAGSLDESGRTPQVLIANYVLGTSNCYVATSHYMVCCASSCESIHSDLEQAIGGALAEPEELLALVSNMSDLAAWDATYDAVPSSLVKQLREIADVHGGKVPLHGRLFAQWLHHAFPRDCPFPHKAGTVVAAGPAGRDAPVISHEAKDEMLLMLGKDSAELEEEGWIPQWSMDEELMSDYAALKRPSRGRTVACVGAALLLLAGLFGATVSNGKENLGASHPSGPFALKAHLV